MNLTLVLSAPSQLAEPGNGPLLVKLCYLEEPALHLLVYPQRQLPGIWKRRSQPFIKVVWNAAASTTTSCSQ